jgi:quercetin dioxygenase-like cupin family protein
MQFEPGQELPTHRNVSRVVITAVRGAGSITVDDAGARILNAGDLVQVGPKAPHSVVAGPDGLELLVVLTPNCCGTC